MLLHEYQVLGGIIGPPVASEGKSCGNWKRREKSRAHTRDLCARVRALRYARSVRHETTRQAKDKLFHLLRFSGVVKSAPQRGLKISAAIKHHPIASY